MEAVAFTGQIRTELGKKGTKAIRKEGKTPCVLYGGDQIIHFSIDVKDVKTLVYTPDFKLAEISIDGATYKCILKEIQFHPVTEEIRHIDFVELVDGQKVNVEIPIRFKGSSPGEKVGGKLYQKLRRVKVKTTPDYLIDELLVDVSTLQMGQSVRVKDIEVDDNLEILSSMNIPVASVEVPRALRSAKAGEEAEAEGEEGEESTGEEGGGEESAAEE